MAPREEKTENKETKKKKMGTCLGSMKMKTGRKTLKNIVGKDKNTTDKIMERDGKKKKKKKFLSSFCEVYAGELVL
jgi:hypothetical protein